MPGSAPEDARHLYQLIASGNQLQRDKPILVQHPIERDLLLALNASGLSIRDDGNIQRIERSRLALHQQRIGRLPRLGRTPWRGNVRGIPVMIIVAVQRGGIKSSPPHITRPGSSLALLVGSPSELMGQGISPS